MPGACTDRATFVADVTIPDGSNFGPNAAFTKTWRIRNSGTCTWSNAYSAIYQSGEKFGSTESVSFSNSVAPNQMLDITVNMTAPASAGNYRGYWILKNASGLLYGIGAKADKPFWAEIKVSGPTATPGAPPVTNTPGNGGHPDQRTRFVGLRLRRQRLFRTMDQRLGHIALPWGKQRRQRLCAGLDRAQT